MGLIRYNNEIKTNETYSIENKIAIRFKDENLTHFLPDSKSFPLFCGNCSRTQSDLFIHLGSRYGQVGTCQCEYCGADIYVTDHDNIVDSIRTNWREIFFNELYLIDKKYIFELQRVTDKPIEEALYCYWNENGRKYIINVNTICDIIEKAIFTESVEEKLTFITDEEYKPLPPDINRWINLLYHAGVELPEYCKCKNSSQNKVVSLLFFRYNT